MWWGKVRQSWFVRFRHGTARWVTAVMVSHGRCGTFRYGLLRQFWFVRFRSVAVCSGVVRQLGCVTVGFGVVRWGLAVEARRD